jgi:hypothetical protein
MTKLPCSSGHLVTPTISYARFFPYRSPAQQPAAAANPTSQFALHPAGPHPGGAGRVIRPRNMSAKAQRRRLIRAHEQRSRLRALDRQQDDDTNWTS